jgi:hypothetical protein
VARIEPQVTPTSRLFSWVDRVAVAYLIILSSTPISQTLDDLSTVEVFGRVGHFGPRSLSSIWGKQGSGSSGKSLAEG